MKKTINPTKTINIVCAVLMLALLVLQFIPFWSLGNESVSISGYIWFPTNHENFTTHFQEALGNSSFNAGNIALINLISMLCSIVGIVFCIRDSDSFWPTVFSIVSGITVVCGYLAKPVFQLGSAWQLHLILGIGLCVLAVINLCHYLKALKQRMQN